MRISRTCILIKTISCCSFCKIYIYLVFTNSVHLHLCRTLYFQFDFPFIQVFRVREFQFRPLVDDVEDTHDTGDSKTDGAQRLRSRMTHNSVWNCDGEIIEEPSLDVR